MIISPTIWRLLSSVVPADQSRQRRHAVTTIVGLAWYPLMLLLAWYLYNRLSPDVPTVVAATCTLTFAWAIAATWSLPWYTAIAWVSLALLPRNSLTRWLTLATGALALAHFNGGWFTPTTPADALRLLRRIDRPGIGGTRSHRRYPAVLTVREAPGATFAPGVTFAPGPILTRDVVACQHGDRGEDAGIPVADELPGPGDARQHQPGEHVADGLRAARARGVRDELDAAVDLEPERDEQRDDEARLAPHLRRRRLRLVIMERTPAAVNISPNTPVTSAGYPVFVSGTRLNSETVSASPNARRAAAARTSRITAG